MSNFPIFGCGLPSKPRATQPSMFEILSWPGEKELSESRFEQQQNKVQLQESDHNDSLIPRKNVQNLNSKTHQALNQNQSPLQNKNIKSQSPQRIVQQTYKVHKSQSQKQKNGNNTYEKGIDELIQNKTKTFIKSKIHQKQIRHQLYSYEPVNLKSSRQKSTVVIKKDEKLTENLLHKQEPLLDQKTIQERKQKLKEFQLFTRALPNSAFTTYYGKPAFQAYGRGASGKNLKSYNIMPHKGDNHPKNAESHYTALMKGRDMKSKSYLPRNPIIQNIVPSENQQENKQFNRLNFALQKPDLIKSNRFVTVRPDTSKKAGPPQMQKSTINGVKRNHTEAKKSKKVEKKTKKIKTKTTNDGLKYMNERENLIDLMEEKKMKASKLAYKVTECYPSELEVSNLKQSIITKENWSQFKPAGKETLRSDQVSDLIQSKLILQQKVNKLQ